MLTLFFNPKKFALVHLLPQNTSLTAACFVDNVIIPLARWHAQQRRAVARRKLHLHFDSSDCHTAQHMQEQMASH
jgi:hypothetical protein